MDDEELALKLFERYLAVKKDSVNAEEIPDIYFSILNKIKSNSTNSYSAPVSSASASLASLDDLPGMGVATPAVEATATTEAENKEPDLESIGFFDLSPQTATQTSTSSTVEPKKDDEEKDLLDQENYFG